MKGDAMSTVTAVQDHNCIKGPYDDHILIPQGSTGYSIFLISNESPYFSDCKSKILASNSL